MARGKPDEKRSAVREYPESATVPPLWSREDARMSLENREDGTLEEAESEELPYE